jgi:hypothetical protein
MAPGCDRTEEVGARATAAATTTATAATAAATTGSEAAGEPQSGVQRRGELYPEYGPARADV